MSDQVEIQKKVKQAIEEAKEEAQELVKTKDILIKQLSEVEDKYEANLIILRQERRLALEKNEALLQELEIKKQQGNLNEQERAQLLEILKVNRQINEEYDRQEEAQDRLRQKLQEAKKVAEDIAGTLGVKKFEDSFLGQFGKMDPQDIENITEELGNYFTATNIGYSMIEKVTQSTLYLAKAQDEMISSFKKATGAGNAYNNILIDSEISLRTFGVPVDEVANSTAALYQNVSKFNDMTEQSKTRLIENTALMERFGVSSSTSARNLQVLTKALGMNTQQATVVTRDLKAMSQALGLPPQVIMEEFGPAMSKLAAHGKDSVRIFKNMAAAAKVTGVEIGELIGIAENFDTFEDAARHVGSLNAILEGPYLNSLEMINATEDERIELMLQAMELSGKNFNELGRYEQKAIATAAGISDMAKANEIFGTSVEELQLAQMKAQSASLSQKELEEVTRDLMTLYEKGATIIQGFAVSMRPVVDLVSYLADGILALQEYLGNFFGWVVLTIGAILMWRGGVLSLVKSLFTFGASLVNKIASLIGFSGASKLAAESQDDLNKKMGKGNASMIKAIPAMLSFGAAILMIGAGISMAAYGLAEFVKSFAALAGPQLAAVMIALGLLTVAFFALMFTLIAFGPVMVPLVPVFLALGAAVLALGAAIFLAGAGFSLIANSIQFAALGICLMLECISGAGKSIIFLFMLSTALYMLSGAMVLFTATSVLFVPAMIGLGIAVTAIGAAFGYLALSLAAALSLLDSDKLNALATTLESIAILSGMKGGVTVTNQAGGAKQSPFTNMVNAVNNLSEEKANQAARVASIASNYNASVGAQPGGGANLSPLATAKEVNLVLNGQIFGKLVANLIDKQKGLKATVVAG